MHTQVLAEAFNKPEFKDLDLMNNWKLLTLFIGANDICSCHSTTPDTFRERLTDAMTQIHQTFPMTFVNVMTIFNISQVWTVSKDKL